MYLAWICFGQVNVSCVCEEKTAAQDCICCIWCRYNICYTTLNCSNSDPDWVRKQTYNTKLQYFIFLWKPDGKKSFGIAVTLSTPRFPFLVILIFCELSLNQNYFSHCHLGYTHAGDYISNGRKPLNTFNFFRKIMYWVRDMIWQEVTCNAVEFKTSFLPSSLPSQT